MDSKTSDAFAIWVTGLPASGKSTLVAEVKARLFSRGIDVAVLESDVLREVFTPHPKYDEAERDRFYRQMVYVGTLLTQHGVPVIFDGTANLRRYRNQGRQHIRQFLEVFMDTPLETCMARDPKGIYRGAAVKAANTVPGLQSIYEAPENPEVVVRGAQEAMETAAERVIAKLAELGYL